MRATWMTRRRAGRLGLAVALLVASLAVLVRSADAHHPEITVSATCGVAGPVVRWTAVAWQTSNADNRINHDVRVQALVANVWQEIARGEFSAANNFQFTSTYALPASITDTLYLQVVSIPRWGAAENLGAPNQYRQTSVAIPANCGGGGGGLECGGSLGLAADHNLFVRGDVTLANSDIGGRVAAGGNVTLTSFGVGSDISASSARIDLAADGAITATNVQVSSGSVTYGTTLTGAVATPQGVVSKAPAPFVATTFADLYQGTAAWAAVTPNGTVTYTGTSPRTATFTGTDPTINVWTVRAADLQGVQQIRVNAPLASTMLVNVTGAAYDTNQAGLSSVSLWNGSGYGQYGYPSSDPVAVAYRTHLLWNFPEATLVQIGPGLAWEGTVFAPYATVELTGGAALNGGVIAANATMGSAAVATELHPYSANPPCLPPGGVPTTPTTPTTPPAGTTTAPAGPTTLPAAPTTISPYCITYGSLSGRVFDDHNANGRFDTGGTAAAADRGVGNVTVRAHDSAGAVVGATTSAADGRWTMNIVASASRDLRVEFSNLPAGYEPGSITGTGGVVQFVGMCDEGVDLAVQIPAHYCQDNPDLAASCQRRGPSSKPVVMTQKWGSGWDATVADAVPDDRAYATGYPDGAGGNTGHPVATAADQIGSVSGLAWRAATRTIYAAAYVKAAAVMGPGGPNAVYAVPVGANGAGLTPSVAVTLPAAAGGSVPLGPDGAPTLESFDAAGRTGLGAMVLLSDRSDPAGDTLYVIGLAARRLYAVSALDAPTKTVDAIDVPLALPGAAQGCPAVDVRPTALTTYGGVLYVGLTCTAESTQDPNAVRAYVYAYDPAGGWAPAPAFELPLTYDRGAVDSWDPTTAPRHWQPWSDDPDVRVGQVHLSDLAITEGFGTQPGDLVVALRSRTGDQTGTSSWNASSAGDILLAPRSGGGWIPEPGLSPTAPSEYFLNDGFAFHSSGPHLEAGRGGLAGIPGYASVAHSQLSSWWTSGITWQNVSTGRIERALSLYTDQDGSTDTFGKTNSLGDLVALCDQAPIEIGDRVWADVDDDGVQDVGEFGLAGVTVELRATNGTLVATTTTDGMGQYRFQGVSPRTGYQVVVELNQAPLQVGPYKDAKSLQGARRDLDSDGVRTGNAVVVAVTTGDPGQNDHSFDIGLVGPAPPRPKCSCATTTTTLPPIAADPPPAKPTYVSP